MSFECENSQKQVNEWVCLCPSFIYKTIQWVGFHLRVVYHSPLWLKTRHDEFWRVGCIVVPNIKILEAKVQGNWWWMSHSQCLQCLISASSFPVLYFSFSLSVKFSGILGSFYFWLLVKGLVANQLLWERSPPLILPTTKLENFKTDALTLKAWWKESGIEIAWSQPEARAPVLGGMLICLEIFIYA